MTTAINQHQNHNLAIWSAVEKTDPAYTKTFNRAGGFSGTAVNQSYQVRRATELFGPIGIGWGFDEVEHFLADGAGGDKVWFTKVRLWYLFEARRGEIEQWGATTFVGKNKNGPFTDEEAGKKSITDAVGKCLSLLGFSADVYQGQFDDQKYVHDRRREEAAKKGSGLRVQGSGTNAQAEAAPSPSTKRQPASREASPPADGNGRQSPTPNHQSPPRDPDPDLAAFREAIAAATSQEEAQRAERLLRSQRALAGRPISDVESALIASCTEAACQRIRAAEGRQGDKGTRRQEDKETPRVAASPPDLAAFHQPLNGQSKRAKIHTSPGPVTGEHLMRPRGAATAHPHTGHREQGTENGAQGTGNGAKGTDSVPGALSPVPSLPSLAADVAAFREFCAQATKVTDVKRGEHVLRSRRLRDRIGLGDAESKLIASWADAACRRIRAARKGKARE